MCKLSVQWSIPSKISIPGLVRQPAQLIACDALANDPSSVSSTLIENSQVYNYGSRGSRASFGLQRYLPWYSHTRGICLKMKRHHDVQITELVTVLTAWVCPCTHIDRFCHSRTDQDGSGWRCFPSIHFGQWTAVCKLGNTVGDGSVFRDLIIGHGAMTCCWLFM